MNYKHNNQASFEFPIPSTYTISYSNQVIGASLSKPYHMGSIVKSVFLLVNVAVYLSWHISITMVWLSLT